MSGGGGFWGKGIQSFGVTMGAIARQKGYGKEFVAKRQGAMNAANTINGASSQIEDLYTPYKNLSSAIMPQLQQAATQQQAPINYARGNEFLDQYYNSPEYATLNSQASDQILRNASATGGIRNGNANASLMNAAPLLGLQARDRENQMRESEYQLNNQANQMQFQNLYNTAGMAQSGVNSLADMYGSRGRALSGLDIYRGEAKGAAARGKYDTQGQMHEDLASIWGS
jgi:hypothetical protein